MLTGLEVLGDERGKLVERTEGLVPARSAQEAEQLNLEVVKAIQELQSKSGKGE